MPTNNSDQHILKQDHWYILEEMSTTISVSDMNVEITDLDGGVAVQIISEDGELLGSLQVDNYEVKPILVEVEELADNYGIGGVKDDITPYLKDITPDHLIKFVTDDDFQEGTYYKAIVDRLYQLDFPSVKRIKDHIDFINSNDRYAERGMVLSIKDRISFLDYLLNHYRSHLNYCDEKIINSKKEREITCKSREKETLLKRWKGNPSSLDLSDLGDGDLEYL